MFPDQEPSVQDATVASRREMSHLAMKSLTQVAGLIFGPLFQTHFSKSEFKNGHISRFCFVFQVIQVISSGKFFSAEEVDLSFIS